jgi:hypothetical protein
MQALSALGMAEKAADGSYHMDQRNVYTMEQLAPILGRVHRLFPAGEGDEYMKQRRTTSVLSFFGVGITTNTPAGQKAEIKKRREALKAAAKKARDLGYVD